ncbi:selenium cofactor biosynthesis protein YqeC [Wenzhouxiangella limi]|uniref:Putative selenium-dependent hydroxylase accessory protein YqeC n=1 Tax=Wenzhouxiangella limi TaxID=2707351 RepID=A0A845VEG7_9GAMM|nr:selenium cofactor biosynthesis protein YqeC [Wenzhouxiangella limi]NDY95639.1 putative selenium-dependent hydroxylase accessory protein YqeC [Wenzhouxiangella limi]
MSALAQALGLRGGIVAAIGAGGKKSVLNELAAGASGRVAWTGTVFTARPPRWTGVEVHIGSEEELLELAANLPDGGRHAFLLPSEKPGRYGGMSVTGVDRLHQAGGFDLTLVKADGARMRGLKCPKPGEPVLPTQTRTVLMVLSAQVIGQPLTDEFVHRPERVAEVLGVDIGATLTPAHLAAVFTRPGGLLEGTDGLAVVPVINQVDDDLAQEKATEAARGALAQSSRFDRVVLTRLKRSGARRAPVIEIVERSEGRS